MNRMETVKALIGAAVGTTGLRVEAANLSLCLVHPLVGAKAAVQTTSNHQGTRRDTRKHHSVVEVAGQVPFPAFVFLRVLKACKGGSSLPMP